MNWPTAIDYHDAISSRERCFGDTDLKDARVIADEHGRPVAVSGDSSLVFEVSSRDQRWAVKCFLRQSANARRRYDLLEQKSREDWIEPLAEFAYLDQGIRVGDAWYPVVKMKWIEGEPLHVHVARHLRDLAWLLVLARVWPNVLGNLRDLGLAHGDLAHENMLVDTCGSIRLVDYDAMFLPSLKGEPSPEWGHVNYQHPRRSEQGYNERYDDFAALVIYASLRGLAADPRLWGRFHSGDNLILSEQDFKDPAGSEVLKRLKQSPDLNVQGLASELEGACLASPEKVPAFGKIVSHYGPIRPAPSIVAAPGEERLKTVTQGSSVRQSQKTPSCPGGEDKRSNATARGSAAHPGLSYTVLDLGLRLLWVNGGIFTMGSPEAEPERDGDEGPPTTVAVSRGYWLGQYPVTEGEWEKLMGTNPSLVKGDSRRPVANVSWTDCQQFLAKLNKQERAAGRLPAGYEYRLPTEAEWEYACRAGTNTRFSFGDSDSQLGDHAWFSSNSWGQTHPVGRKKPNPWGFHDLHGNVWEWCSDCYADMLPGGSVVDPAGSVSGPNRVCRGGSWERGAQSCRSANRFRYVSYYRCDHLGFRLVLGTVPPTLVSQRLAPLVQSKKTPQAVAERPSPAISIKGPVPPPAATRALPTTIETHRGRLSKASATPKFPSPESSLPQQPHTVTCLGTSLLWVAPGTFLMGSPDTELGRDVLEGPQTRVTISQGYWLGECPMTEGEWGELMKADRSARKRDNRLPVRSVSWNDCQMFLQKLNATERAARRLPEGYEYRLPTSAEWEYACRAATTTRFGFGDDESRLSKYAWYAANSENRQHPVHEKQPNAWGFYDMHGNVKEWCEDWIGPYPGGEHLDYSGPNTGSFKVLRGGSWSSHARNCRSANVDGHSPVHHYDSLGFRLALGRIRTGTPAAGGTAPVSATESTLRESRTRPDSPIQPKSPVLALRSTPSSPAPVARIARPIADTGASPQPGQLWTILDLGLPMRWVKPGRFTMGSPIDEADRMDAEGPQTVVTISRGLWLGEHPVTQKEWEEVTGSNPSHFLGKRRRPVENVSWADCQQFLAILNKRERAEGRLPAEYEYRLPTEAEWEYACRAGAKTKFTFGDDEAGLAQYAWYKANSDGKTHPVAERKANEWNFFDMHGNVWEWCLDWHSPYPGGSLVDYRGPASGTSRINRGGAWGDDPRSCRSANRCWLVPDEKDDFLGFRLALGPAADATQLPTER